mmetsp:Transcript_2445/g.5165  ORF Transcript_2445/g.5165 Transcript_2445/m.5165 type:complete len:86 (-) Transcript_2445:47-304(-)
MNRDTVTAATCLTLKSAQSLHMTSKRNDNSEETMVIKSPPETSPRSYCVYCTNNYDDSRATDRMLSLHVHILKGGVGASSIQQVE